MTQGKDSKWLERVVFTGDFLFFKFQISGLNILEQMLSISIPSRKPRCYEVLHVLCNKCIFPKKVPIRSSRKERIVMHHSPNFALSTSRRWHTHCETIRPGGKRHTRSLLVGLHNDQPPRGPVWQLLMKPTMLLPRDPANHTASSFPKGMENLRPY